MTERSLVDAIPDAVRGAWVFIQSSLGASLTSASPDD
jgi:hypothetical protein